MLGVLRRAWMWVRGGGTMREYVPPRDAVVCTVAAVRCTRTGTHAHVPCEGP